MTRLRFSTGCLLVAAACSRGDGTTTTNGEAQDAGPVAPGLERIQPTHHADGSVRILGSRAEIPLRGPRVDGDGGDFLLEAEGNVAVVAARTGNVIDFGARDGDDGLVAIEPTLYLAIAAQRAEGARVAQLAGVPVVRIDRRIAGRPLGLTTLVYFVGRELKLESIAWSTTEPTMALTVGEHVAWGNLPTWVEGHGFLPNPEASESLSGDFIAVEGFGVAYALANDRSRTVARFGAAEPGFHESANTGEAVVSLARGATAARREVTVAHARSMGDAAAALAWTQRASVVRSPFARDDLPTDARVEVHRCGADGRSPGSPYVRFSAHGRRELPLPKGCFVARVAAPGYAPSEWRAPEALSGVATLRAGSLKWSVRERGSAGVVPAHLLVHGVDGTPDPDWGDGDALDGSALDTLYTEGAGERPLPPGKYSVLVSRGFEYGARESRVAVEAGKTSALDVELERVVDTRGWIAADLHLHAAPSPDAPTALLDRVRSLAAVGVEVGVATDHNRVTDYSPVIRDAGLSERVASVVGDEITTTGTLFGHMNVFPLAAGSNAIAFADVTPRGFVAEARRAKPADRDKVVQLNHPRMGAIGYFELMRFDEGDVAAWKERATLADMSFDAIEVFNGDHYADIAKVERCMRDWYALLNAGFHVTATGNSDSHKLVYQEAGVPRNLVRVTNDAPGAFDEREFVDAIRKGKVVVSSGPFVRIEANGAGVGETVAAADDVEVRVRVDAPPWVDVSEVTLLRRGEVARAWTAKPGAPFDQRVRMPLAKGDWIIAVARGKKPMTFLHRAGATPFGFTNPIWVQ